MRYMYMSDNQSLMTAGVFHYFNNLKTNGGEVMSSDSFIRFGVDGTYNEELVNSLYDEDIVILGFVPNEAIISSLLSKSNRINHYIVLREPRPAYSSSIISHPGYKSNVYYCTDMNRCNCLHLWKMLFPRERHPNILELVNNQFICNNSSTDLPLNEKAIYAYIGSLDSSSPLPFSSLISEDINNTLQYDNIIDIGNSILSYVNQIETRGVLQ